MAYALPIVYYSMYSIQAFIGGVLARFRDIIYCCIHTMYTDRYWYSDRLQIIYFPQVMVEQVLQHSVARCALHDGV